MFGITLVGNFQFVNISVVHFLGAFLAFVGCIVLEFLVATLSYQMNYPKALVLARYAIGTLAIISALMSKSANYRL